MGAWMEVTQLKINLLQGDQAYCQKEISKTVPAPITAPLLTARDLSIVITLRSLQDSVDASTLTRALASEMGNGKLLPSPTLSGGPLPFNSDASSQPHFSYVQEMTARNHRGDSPVQPGERNINSVNYFSDYFIHKKTGSLAAAQAV